MTVVYLLRESTDEETIINTINKNANFLGLGFDVRKEEYPIVELKGKKLPEPIEISIRVDTKTVWASYKDIVKQTPKDRLQKVLRAIKVTIHLHDAIKNPDKYLPLETHERTFADYMNKVLEGLETSRPTTIYGGGD